MSSERVKFWEAWGQADALYEEWAAAHGVGTTRLFVLYALTQREGLTQRMLADYTGMPKQTVHNTVRALKNEGYVVFSAQGDDRREKQLVLTESGRLYALGLLTPLYELEERVFEIMGADSVRRLLDLTSLFNTIFAKEMKRRSKDNAQ